MKKYRVIESFCGAIVAFALFAETVPAADETQEGKPPAKESRLRMCPDFRADVKPLFYEKAPWEETKKALSVFKLHIRMLNDSDEMPAAPGQEAWKKDWKLNVPQMVQSLARDNIQLEIEAAGLYGAHTNETGRKSAEGELALIERIYQAGGKVSYLMLDGPISRVIKGGRSKGVGGAEGTLNYNLEESVHHLVVYIQTVHARHPEIEIGLGVNFGWWDFQGQPSFMGTNSFSQSGYEYNQVLDAVLAALEKAGEKITFIEADSPWDYMVVDKSPYHNKPVNETAKLLALEAYCKKKGLKFGYMINSEARTTKDEPEFYNQTLDMLRRYHSARGRPDYYVVESWHAFTRTLLPEDQAFSFTRLTRDFNRHLQGMDATERKGTNQQPDAY
ncbi:MAG: hypothetical protein WCO77_13800, partial [bacterium]